MNLEILMHVLAGAALAAGAFSFFMTGSNALWLLGTRRVPTTAQGSGGAPGAPPGGPPGAPLPKISVLIPARNEAGRIQPCLDSLLAQRYPDYELIVFDDDSRDGTGSILDEYALAHPDRLRVIHGKRLGADWYGKPHALQKLSEKARGEWLLFTDADTVHGPDSIARLLSLAVARRADLVSGYVQYQLKSFGEAAVVPSIYLLTMLIMPLWLIGPTRLPFFSHAIGQVMFFRNSFYQAIGGYAAVRHRVTEDIHIARLVKARGGTLLFADLKDQVACRMYEGYKASVDGISKNVYDYLNKNFLLLGAATLAVPLLAFLPLIGAVLVPAGMETAQPLFRLGVLFAFLSWGIVTLERRLPWYIPFISPLILCNALSAGWRAFHLFSKGRAVEWKGRQVR